LDEEYLFFPAITLLSFFLPLRSDDPNRPPRRLSASVEASLTLPTLRDLDDLKLNREEESREVYERSELVLLPLGRLPRVARPRIGIIVLFV
jgi:hypothetical protein